MKLVSIAKQGHIIVLPQELARVHFVQQELLILIQEALRLTNANTVQLEELIL